MTPEPIESDEPKTKSKAPKAPKETDESDPTETSSEVLATGTLDLPGEYPSPTPVGASDQPSHGETISVGGALLSGLGAALFLYVL